MRIISFDVGIKNLAYCMFDILDDKTVNIIDWNVVNLLETPPLTIPCTCINKPKSKKVVGTICTKVAKYTKVVDGSMCYFCDTHAKKTHAFMIPKKQWSRTSLTKLKREALVAMCTQYSVHLDTMDHKTKKDMLDLLVDYFEKRCLVPIIPVKTKGAHEVDLITIGKKMKEMLNLVTYVEDVTHVLIENQISPIANRMKTIQGMLAQYFIMRNSDVCIEFISSSNKLKDFQPVVVAIPSVVDSTSEATANANANANANALDKSVYKKHKSDGVLFCTRIVQSNILFKNWENVLANSKKQDDLADCFLQGIWYIKNKQIAIVSTK